jgi:hypothetical protein
MSCLALSIQLVFCSSSLSIERILVKRVKGERLYSDVYKGRMDREQRFKDLQNRRSSSEGSCVNKDDKRSKIAIRICA